METIGEVERQAAMHPEFEFSMRDGQLHIGKVSCSLVMGPRMDERGGSNAVTPSSAIILTSEFALEGVEVI